MTREELIHELRTIAGLFKAWDAPTPTDAIVDVLAYAAGMLEADGKRINRADQAVTPLPANDAIACDLDEWRFHDPETDEYGYEIVCVNPEHRLYVCPREGEMFRFKPRASRLQAEARP